MRKHTVIHCNQDKISFAVPTDGVFIEATIQGPKFGRLDAVFIARAGFFVLLASFTVWRKE